MAKEVDLTKEKVSGKEIKEQRKTNRFFGLFLIIDILLLAFIVIEIVTLVTK